MIEKPDMSNCSDKQFNQWYWGDFHSTCKNCTNTCKQSHIVTLSCSKFNKRKDIDESKESVEMA